MNTANKPAADTAPLSIGEIAQRIQLIRGQRVVLDADLAAFYGETTKRFNQQVNRNRARFSADFMFQLDEQEFANLRLQFATSSLKGGHGGRRYAPLAFTEHGARSTEHGAIMASMVLNSQRATALSVYVVRAFVELRGMLASNQTLANKVQPGAKRHGRARDPHAQRPMRTSAPIRDPAARQPCDCRLDWLLQPSAPSPGAGHEDPR